MRTLAQFTDKDFEIVDVREKEAYIADNFGFRNIPFSAIKNDPMQFSFSDQTVFICENGVNSRAAVTICSSIMPDHQFDYLIGGIQEARSEIEKYLK